MHASSILFLLLSPYLAVAQVVGSAYGFAKGVSGGGSAAAAAPADIAQQVPNHPIQKAITKTILL